MKKTIASVAIIFCCLFAFGQKAEEYENIIKKAPFIFEGNVIEQVYFVDTDNSDKAYTANIVQISKVLRGGKDIKLGTISIVTEGGMKEKNGMIISVESSHPADFTANGIYFCYPASSKEMGPIYPSSGKIVQGENEKKSFDNDNSTSLKTLGVIDFRSRAGMGRGFKDRQEMYDFLKGYDNISIPNEEKKTKLKEEQPVKKKDASGSLNVISKENQIKYAKNVENHEKYMEFLQARIDIAAKKTGNSCEEPFISEMIEANAPNRALELFNPSDVAVDLSDFSIRLFQNGQLTPLIIPLSGTIPAKGTFVIAHQAAKPEIKAKADMLDPQLAFDGNDAIVLEKTGGTQVDKIGEIGVNPGNGGWSVPPNGSTKEQTLRRKYPVDRGETNWNQGKNQWTVHPKDSVSNLKQHQNVCTSTVADEISFSFANAIETGVMPNKFLEFDIEVSTNASGTYYDNTVLIIQYNTTAFGTNVVANGNITVTKGAAFNILTYIDPNTIMVDDAVDEVRIPFGTDPAEDGNLNRTLIDATPIPLFHVKIAIQTCNTNSQLQFTNTVFAGFFSAYTFDPTDSINAMFFYDDALFPNNQLNTLLCVPNIINFTSPVFPGTYVRGSTNMDHLLTINGTNFGVAQGFGNVFFHDANKPLVANPYFPLDKFDFLSWTNSQIVIRMPSRMDSIPNQPLTPGSGLFYVKTNLGDSIFSSTEIDMPYSIRQARIGSPLKGKIRYNMVGPLDSGAYEFRVDTSIANNPDALAVLDKAVREWSCLTGIRWSLGPSISLQAQTGDGVSVIYFNSSATTLGNTLLEPGACTNSAGDTIVYPEEIDIYFERNLGGVTGWFYDTLFNDLPLDSHDFFAVAEHELGHGHVLRHVNQQEDLLWFQATIGPDSAINRKEAVNSISGIDGGQEIIATSLFIVLGGGCTAVNLMIPTAGENCLKTGIKNRSIREDIQIINAYPNPLGGDVLNISYELNTRANVNFRIIDYTGKQILIVDKGNLHAGKHQESINADQLTPGFYFLMVGIGEKSYTKKIVKL